MPIHQFNINNQSFDEFNSLVKEYKNPMKKDDFPEDYNLTDWKKGFKNSVYVKGSYLFFTNSLKYFQFSINLKKMESSFLLKAL